MLNENNAEFDANRFGLKIMKRTNIESISVTTSYLVLEVDW